MSNLRFVVDNLVRDATTSVITGTEVASLPTINITNYNKGRYSRTIPDTGTAKIRITLAAYAAISAVVLGPSNLTSVSTVTYELLNAGLTVLATVAKTDVAPVVPFGTLVWGVDPLGAVFTNKFAIPGWFDQAYENVAYIDITITDPALTEINLSYVYAGVYIEPARDASKGVSLTFADTNSTYRTEDGSLRTTAGVSFRKFTFDMGLMGESDRLMLLRFINKKLPIVISLFQVNSSPLTTQFQEIDYTAVVKSTNAFEATTPYLGFYNTSLTFEEI